MVKMQEESNTPVSNWWLYIGIFLCASGIGLVVGAIFIAYWAIKRLEGVKLGNSYTENNHTENNYSINIQGNHGGNGGSGGGNGNNQSPKSNPKPKTKNYLKAIANKTVPMNHISDSNLERGK